MTADWPSVLDEVERRLVLTEEGVSAGRFAFEPVEFPPALGPLPPHCRDRAQSLHDATVEMEHRVAAAMQLVNAQLAHRASQVAARPRATYVDRMA